MPDEHKCPKCGKWTDDYPLKADGTPRQICRTCYNDNRKVSLKVKVCQKCGKSQTVSNYEKNQNYKDGYHPSCKTCRHEEYEQNKVRNLDHARQTMAMHKAQGTRCPKCGVADLQPDPDGISLCCYVCGYHRYAPIVEDTAKLKAECRALSVGPHGKNAVVIKVCAVCGAKFEGTATRTRCWDCEREENRRRSTVENAKVRGKSNTVHKQEVVK